MDWIGWIFKVFKDNNKGIQLEFVAKNLPALPEDKRDMSSIAGSGRSPGGGHDNPLQYFCL